jgi:predicted nucleotidyltransferase
MSKHQEIVKEIFEEYKDRDDVIGIVNFGSVASGKERPDSDVDVYIVFDGNVKWELFREMRHGIKVDFEVVGKADFEKYTNEYPYLYYFEHDKILLDKTGIVKKIFDKLKDYFEKHVSVSEFWRDEYKIMRELKNSGKKEKHFADVCDDAEKKFSDYHSIKRKIMTKEWFNEHDRD